MTKSTIKKQAFIGGLLFAILSLALRVICLNDNDIALDEPFTLYWANKSIIEILNLSLVENNPPLPFLLQHFWLRTFGLEDSIQRIPALLFGISTVFVLVRFTILKSSLIAGVFLGLLLTFSNEHMYFSHELRAYSLLAFLSVLAFILTVSQAENQKSSKQLYYLFLVFILLLYTHYLSVYVIFASCLCIIFFSNGISRFRQFIGPVVMFILGVMPVIYTFYIRLGHVRETGSWVPEPHWSQLYGHINILLNSKFALLGLLLTLIAFIFYLLFTRKLKEKTSQLFSKPIFKYSTIWFMVIYLGLFIQSLFFEPAFIPRYIFFSSAFLFVGISLLFNEAASISRITALFTALFFLPFLLSFQINPQNNREMKLLIETVETKKSSPECIIIICPSSFDLAYAFHADKELFYSEGDIRTGLNSSNIFPVDHADEIPEKVLNQATAITYIDADAKFTLPNNGIVNRLSKDYNLVSFDSIPGIFAVRYFNK